MNKPKFDYLTHPKTLLNFNDVYHDVKILGSGHFGETRLIMDKLTKKLYALKMINAEQFNVNDYYREVSALITLSEPHCNSVLVCYKNHFMMNVKNKMRYAILTDYIDGMTLEKYNELYTLNYKNIVDIGLWLLKTVAWLHDRGFAHNDISIANIMVTKAGALKLIDFGLTCYTIKRIAYLTCSKNRLVNIYYQSPEIQSGLYMTNVNKYSKTSDIYAIGIVLYELLTGHHPHQGHVQSDDYFTKQRPCFSNVLKRLLLINPNQRITAHEGYIEFLKCKKN